jgi:hypothetical protein
MASERDLIVKRSLYNAMYVVAYDGTNGAVPLALNGEYTNESSAKTAIMVHLAQRAAAQSTEPSGEPSGNSKRK